MNKKNEIEELKKWTTKTDICLSNMILAANDYLEQFEHIPKLHEKIALCEEALCTAQLSIQEIEKYGDT